MSDAPRRRLSDKIIDAHTKACEEGRMDVADMLLQALEMDLSAMGGQKNEGREGIAELEEAFIRHEEAKTRHGG